MHRFQILTGAIILMSLSYLSSCSELCTKDQALNDIMISAPASLMRSIDVSIAKKPKGFYSAGLVGNLYRIKAKNTKTFPLSVALSYDPNYLTGLDESTLTLFFKDSKTAQISPLSDSKVDMHTHAVHGTISGSGTVMVIGLPREPRAREILGDLTRWIDSGMMVSGMGLRIQRTCELIRCAGMQQTLNDRLATSLYLGGSIRPVTSRPTPETRPPNGYVPRQETEIRELPFPEGGPGIRDSVCDECPDIARGMLDEVVVGSGYIEDLFPERRLMHDEPCQKVYLSH